MTEYLASFVIPETGEWIEVGRYNGIKQAKAKSMVAFINMFGLMFGDMEWEGPNDRGGEPGVWKGCVESGVIEILLETPKAREGSGYGYPVDLKTFKAALAAQS